MEAGIVDKGRAPGTVVGLVSQQPANSGINSDALLLSLFPVVTWTPPARVQQSFTGRAGSGSPRHHNGWAVTVAYDEKGRQPTSLVGDASVLAVLFLGLGALAVVGVVVLLVSR